ncbi:retrovirus-related pol polyprotein from transposon TNT 1-94 [Tanacetum coccineum]|uniref:Retrovirus-related pol polyprotein from transposon TNT 1-94 n=1 Tax=Tanacetum coccineum TaxID=301880 RepID=A0ABQ4ZBA0_9ASTR
MEFFKLVENMKNYGRYVMWVNAAALLLNDARTMKINAANDFSCCWIALLSCLNKVYGSLIGIWKPIGSWFILILLRDIIELCGSKGIKREYINAKTPQQNEVAERKNRTLIEAARTKLAYSFLPNTFWVKAVSTAFYVLNRVLVTKPQNKTPYELITGKIPIISYIRPFGCHVTILNTIDHLGKFEEKFDEGFLVGYSLNSKAFRVYNLETKRVKENLHINFLENKPNVAGKGPNWLFDLDYLTDSMNYQSVIAENKANKTAGPKEANHSPGTQDNIDAGNSEIEAEPAQEYFVLPLWSSYTSTKMNKKAAGEDTSKKEKVLGEPDSTKMEVNQEEVEESTRKRPGTILKMKARKKARKQTHADSNASKKKKRSPRMKRMSKRKKTDSGLEEEEHLKTFLKIVLDKE